MIDVADEAGRRRLAAALGVERWTDEVVARSPYESLDALLDAARRAGADLTDEELDEAVAHHPRIGERNESDADADAENLSAAEQAGLGPRDEGVDAAIDRGNAVYEGRFGRVFLIRAAGRTRQEVLDELQRRLKNDPAAESDEAKQQLREIAAARLRAQLEEPA